MDVLVPDPAAIARAAELLRTGHLVVIPTETVYGLAANALDPGAVAKIFEAKGRPNDNPVIAHVASVAEARKLASAWPAVADRLADAFWPGPLTLVLPRAAGVPDAVTAGLDSVAIRVPRHPVALAVLRAAGIPVAAPSANVSGRPSPTRVMDAVLDLGTKADLYLDGGPCEVGVESTVIDVRGDKPTLLRQGGIAAKDIEAVIGPLAKPAKVDHVRSPGMKYRHYAPATPLVLATPLELAKLWRDVGFQKKTVWLVATETLIRGPTVQVVAGRADAAAWAQRIFAALRDADAKKLSRIVVEAIPADGLGAAVLERLRKAQDAAKDFVPQA